MQIARIRCDKIDYALPERSHTGNNLREFFGVPKTKHLYCVGDPEDTLVPEDEEEFYVADGARFFTMSKQINQS